MHKPRGAHQPLVAQIGSLGKTYLPYPTVFALHGINESDQYHKGGHETPLYVPLWGEATSGFRRFAHFVLASVLG